MIRSASQVIRKDLPYITCQVCKIAMGEVWDIAEQMRKDAPYNRVDEGEFQELTFGICDPDIEDDLDMDVLYGGVPAHSVPCPSPPASPPSTP